MRHDISVVSDHVTKCLVGPETRKTCHWQWSQLTWIGYNIYDYNNQFQHTTDHTNQNVTLGPPGRSQPKSHVQGPQ